MAGANTDSLHLRLAHKLGYPRFKTNHQHYHEYFWPEAEALLKDAGFVVERAKGIFLFPFWGVPGVGHVVRHITDHDAEFVEAMRVLGERAGPEFAYCYITRAQGTVAIKAKKRGPNEPRFSECERVYCGESWKFFSVTDSIFPREKKTGKYLPRAHS